MIRDITFEELATWFDSCHAIEIDDMYLVYPPQEIDGEIIVYASDDEAANGISYCKFTKDQEDWLMSTNEDRSMVTATSPTGTFYQFVRLGRV
jgi:hypothetical protein